MCTQCADKIFFTALIELPVGQGKINERKYVPPARQQKALLKG